MDVHAMHAAYGDYATANTFTHNDDTETLPESEALVYSAAFEQDPNAKQHAACDECRKRKLKCSGQPTGCERCGRQRLTCHYSKQAQMGRPRKKRKTSEEADNIEEPPPATPVERLIHPTAPSSTSTNNRAEFENLCTGPYAQYVKRKTPAPLPPFVTQNTLYEHASSLMASSNGGTPPTESPPTPILARSQVTETEFPKDAASWPDFSTMAMLPQIVQDNHPPRSDSIGQLQSADTLDSMHNLSTIPSCPCLPNLYLTLSSLSTLTSFPVSIHTIESLQTAHRTAQSVLYCTVCPTKFQSGIQNVMLSGTLLTVLADNWHRVRTATGEELRNGFSPPRTISVVEESPITDMQSLEWRTFAYHLLRANVFGDKMTPCPPCNQGSTEIHSGSRDSADQVVQPCHHLASINSSESTPTLLSLIDAMDRRQSAWHGKIPDTGEFPKHLTKTTVQEYMRGMTLEQLKEIEMDEKGYLCLSLVHRARTVLQTLDKQEPVL